MSLTDLPVSSKTIERQVRGTGQFGYIAWKVG